MLGEALGEPSGVRLVMWRVLVIVFKVLLEQIAAEVAGSISPHRVHVVGVVLRVVVLDDERGAAQAVVMTLTRLVAPIHAKRMSSSPAA